MKASGVFVGNEYALRLPVEGVSEDLWPLTRALVVSASSTRAKPIYQVTVASYEPTNVHEFAPGALPAAIIDGKITYERTTRQLKARIADFVRPWGSHSAHEWAVSPSAGRNDPRASQLVMAGAQ